MQAIFNMEDEVGRGVAGAWAHFAEDHIRLVGKRLATCRRAVLSSANAQLEALKCKWEDIGWDSQDVMYWNLCRAQIKEEEDRLVDKARVLSRKHLFSSRQASPKFFFWGSDYAYSYLFCSQKLATYHNAPGVV